jgi:molybdenum cofactor sulfurtransferase
MSARSTLGRPRGTKSVRDAAEAAFLAAYPGYAQTSLLDEMRQSEYGRLDAEGIAYLDYTGSSLYGASQVEKHAQLLTGAVFGNPHSASPPSQRSTEAVERARAALLRHVHADEAEYDVVFTANASAALKLVGEAYRFDTDADLLLAYDNHNSVHGLREFAAAKGARVAYAPIEAAELRLEREALEGELAAPARSRHAGRLFAFPAQSNFTGVQHSLDWVARARAQGWEVLVDAAAYLPTNDLDLGAVGADFVVLSFYKMFGYPTGVGALIARRPALARLARPWFAGGTVAYSSVQTYAGAGTGFLRAPGHQGFEDGTPDFLAASAVEIGLAHLADVGLDRLHERVRCLTAWTLGEFAALRHGSGGAVIQVYGPPADHERGAIVLFNVLDALGQRLDADRVQEAAADAGIAVRSGCHCNPGGCEVALAYASDAVANCASAVDPFGAPGHVDGAVRASFGIASNFADASRLVRFLATYAL